MDRPGISLPFSISLCTPASSCVHSPRSAASGLPRAPWLAWIGAAMLLASPALAVDGVVEINAARAAAGGVTASDTAGYPVTLDAAGSYRLTGPLSPGGPGAIEVTASGPVDLDLNGFGIAGPESCLGGSETILCTGGAGVGVKVASDVPSVRVHDGAIHGMLNGLDLDMGTGILEDLDVYENQGRGIQANGGRISDCLVERNGQHGLELVTALNGYLVTDNVVQRNGGDGISAGGAEGVVRGNVVHDNGGWGLVSEFLNTPTGTPGYAGNQFADDTSGNVRGGTQIGQNMCETALCP